MSWLLIILIVVACFMLVSCIFVIVVYIYRCKKDSGHNLQAVANGQELNNPTELNEMNV